MTKFFKIFICLFPLLSLAQQNYISGDITNCYTWAPFADVFSRLNAVVIKTGTILNVNKDINVTSVTFNGNATSLSVVGTNKLILSGKTTDVTCGGVYGEDNGSGKHVYFATTTIDCSSPVTTTDYTYTGYTLTFGPFQRGGTYKWTKFIGTLYNRYPRSMLPCTSCWTTDWNLRAMYYINESTTPTDYVTSYIWSNRDRISQKTICGENYEVYSNNYWNFGNVNVTVAAGDIIKIRLTTPLATGGTSAESKTCCLAPMHYMTLDIQLEEQ